MPAAAVREIPFNYTSADDRQVVTLLLGEEAWGILERLRGQRVTGRSARLLLRFLGQVPACCGEAGKLFDRKEQELAAALSERPAGAGPAVLLTNCPACLQGLGRQARQGLTVQHLAVRLAEAASVDWQAELKALAAGAEVVTF